MNRLKHVLGSNVSHTVLSHVISTRRNSDLRWTASRVKRAVDPKFADNGEQRDNSAGSQKRRLKSRTILGKRALEKYSEEERFQNRRRASCQAKKSSSQYSNRKQVGKPTNSKNDAESVETAVIEDEAGSYARMIAAYSEDVYSKNAFAAPKDGAGSAMIARTRPSPFSNSCVISMKPFLSAGPVATSHEAKFSTETSAVQKNLRNSRGDSVESGGAENELERSATYAAIIERYSHTVTLNVDPRAWGSNGISRRHVSTKFDNVSGTAGETEGVAVAAETKEIVGCSKKSIPDGSSGPKANDNREKREVRRESQTTKDVIKDPRRIATMKDDTDAKSREKLASQPAEEPSDWLEKMVEAHKKRIRDRKAASARTPEGANENVEMSGNKPTNPISDYIRRGATGSNAQRGAGQASTSNSAQSSAVSDPARQPQIELRMTPSQNESVVAINVDELSRNFQAGQDRLSVVISSKKNANAPDRANAETRPDFGSMQISISEDTVPVKQIEFSINGKPVSELKSIVARTDKLDVLGSMDKVEIRIPSKDNNNARTTNQQYVARPAAHPAVLNLHINAKFNDPRVQQPKSTGAKRETSPATPRVIPPNQSPVPPRSYKVSSSSQNEPVSKPGDTVANVEGGEELLRKSQINPTEVFQRGASRTPSNNLAGNVDKAVSENANSGANQLPRNSQDTRVNPEKPGRDGSNREPSNMIPWWSSEEAFNNIKRKGSGGKDASPGIVDAVAEPKRPEASVERICKISDYKPESADIGKSAENAEIVAQSSRMEVERKEVRVERSRELSDANVVKVTSSQRYVPTNKSSKQHAKRKSKVAKKASRVRSTTKTTPKQHFDWPINSVPSPKVVKFVAVTPRRVDVDSGTETKSAAVKNRPTIEEETRGQRGDAARAADGNAERSDTVIEPADLERSANRSAGVSAKSASAASESGTGAAEGKAPDKMSDAIKKLLPGGRPPGKRVVDRRMAEILKSMKPIEKREDGTLIDYGVTVSSRKPSKSRTDANGVPQVLPVSKNLADRPNSAKLKQDAPGRIEIIRELKVSTKTKEVKDDRAKVLEGEKLSSGRKEVPKSKGWDKVVDLAKISSVKKETLTEPKVVTKQSKVVEPVKVLSAKKPNVPEDATSSTTKKQLHQGPGNITYQPRLDSEYMLSKQWVPDADRESDKFRHSRAKARLEGTKETVDAPISSDSMKILPTERTGGGANLVKSKVSSKPTRESADKKETPSITSKGLEARSGVTESYNPQLTVKKCRIRSCPPTQRAADKKAEKMPPEIVDERFKVTGAAPLKGTIRQQPSKGNLANFSKVGKVERVETPRPDNTESGGGSSGFGNFIVGPAGLKSSRSFVMHTITSADKVSKRVSTSLQREEKLRGEEMTDVEKPINEEHRQLYLAPSRSERPEKDLLYASWLQRFKNSIDDDKIL
nr:uncharacterized protein LOC117222213 isoform X1 [Megalopta genalis]